MKADELEARLRRLERLGVAALIPSEGIAITHDPAALAGLRRQAIIDARQILNEHEQARPPLETRVSG